MPESVAGDYSDLIAERIRSNHGVIASRWLERLRELLPVGTNEIFPSTDLLDHIPALIQELSEYVRMPETESVAANTAVLAKAQNAVLDAIDRAREAYLQAIDKLPESVGGLKVALVVGWFAWLLGMVGEEDGNVQPVPVSSDAHARPSKMRLFIVGFILGP